MRKGLFDRWEFAFHPGTEQLSAAPEELVYQPVTLPHDWMIDRPINRDMRQGLPQGYFDRWGTGFYRRTLSVQKRPGLVYRLCFDGVYENSRVWVNGTLLGGWGYGYTPFVLDATQALRDGENQLLVQVDNTQFPADRWYSGAGIYRMVWLETLPEEHLDISEITTKTTLTSQGPRFTVGIAHPGRKRVTLSSPDSNWQAETDGCEVSFADPVLRLWSAEDPYRYTLRIELPGSGDALTLAVGLRTVETDSRRGLLVNGVPVKLKGVCLHQDAGCFGTAVTLELWRERLQALKEIGCNALRLAHHLHIPELLDLCDELGFYVYEEPFDKWMSGAYLRHYERDWKADLSAMVLRDRWRPCVLIWGVGNEVENQAHASMLRLLEQHVAAVKALDTTRPVSLAMNPHFAYEECTDLAQVENIQQVVDEMTTGEILNIDEKIERVRRIGSHVDILGCNYMEQWYEAIHEAIPDKLILGTETYQFFRGKDELFQAYHDRCPWHDVTDQDWCIGGMIWSGIDYLGESVVWPAKGWSGALFTANLEKRPMAYVYQSWWTEAPVVHFAVLDMSLADEGVKEHWDAPRYKHHWSFPQYQAAMIPYMVATNCEQIEIYLDGRCYRPAPTKDFPNGIVQGWLPYWPGEVVIVGLRAGREVCRDTVVTPGVAVRLQFEQEEITVDPRRDDAGRAMPYQLLCKVQAYDQEDRPVFHAYARVRFTVEGPAKIVGTDNGDLQRTEPFTDSEVHLYGGQASAALQITGKGCVRLTAYAPGLRPASTMITAEGWDCTE